MIKQNRKFVQQKSIKISWLKDGNKSKCLNDIEDFKDKGWAAGPTASLHILFIRTTK